MAESFDIVAIRNALDHSINPILGLYNMLSVCKIGGLILLEHAENEAQHENYIGLHQWNITKKDEDLIFWNRETTINVSSLFADAAKTYVEVIEGGERPWVKAKIMKSKNASFSTEYMNIHDQVLTKAAFLFFSKTYRQLQKNK
jgi:hypothetical protein